MKTILLVFGTRPEAIKMAPLVKEFQNHPEQFDTKVCVTAQHREMLDQVLNLFEIAPDFDLNIMKAWTYITTNRNNTVLYTGVTSNIKSRMEAHKTKKYESSFTARYHADKLVWFQEFDSIIDAREREKQLKAGSRQRKIDLINKLNPSWDDLFETL